MNELNLKPTEANPGIPEENRKIPTRQLANYLKGGLKEKQNDD